MATEDEHIAQANRNQEVLSLLILDPLAYSDWIAIIAFYKALHIVEAVFYNQNRVATLAGQVPNPIPQNNQRHVDRNDNTKKLFPNVWRNYSHLYKTSLIARYLEYRDHTTNQLNPYSTFAVYMPHTVVMALLLGQYLVQLENESLPLLANPSALNRFVLPPPLPATAPNVPTGQHVPPTVP